MCSPPGPGKSGSVLASLDSLRVCHEQSFSSCGYLSCSLYLDLFGFKWSMVARAWLPQVNRAKLTPHLIGVPLLCFSADKCVNSKLLMNILPLLRSKDVLVPRIKKCLLICRIGFTPWIAEEFNTFGKMSKPALVLGDNSNQPLVPSFLSA